jgi:2-desacetyl-2-hydroxyethyl bacteriochlorophyllide A dehydrogenase
VLGHELGVEVLEAGQDVDGLRPGDLCAVEPYLACGSCVACLRGRTNCCAHLQVLGVHVDGGMRERMVVPAGLLHRSQVLPADQLALVETLAIGAHAVDRAQIEQGEPALVIGVGPIGLSVAQFACLAGARVVVMDVRQSRLDFCARTLPIEGAIHAEPDALEVVASATGGDLASAVFDATGSPESMNRSFGFVASGGRLILVSLVQASIQFDDPEFHRREMTLLATRNSTAADFTRVIGLMESGRLDASSWITHRAGLLDVPRLFADWLDPASAVVKAMIEC